MSFQLAIPRLQGSLAIPINRGEILFVLGSNGTGKSSLMHEFFVKNVKAAHRISAHRQTWFSSSSVSLTGQGKVQQEEYVRSSDSQADSRWKDDYAATRPTIAIYDLVDSENVRARTIASAVDAKNIKLAEQESEKDGPIKVLNQLLRLSNLPIQISVRGNEEIVASKSNGVPYGIAKLSDGERNALLIAADVLTAQPDTLLLIDEPERHLHRSIISPLLTNLFKVRSDCTFVISTHDVLLPLDNPTARTLLVRGCSYANDAVRQWDADLLPPETALDESLKRDIVGARRKVLFVEGTVRSLDQPLYALLFPEASVIYKNSCRDVEHAVDGLRGAAELHWVHAFGIVDNDGRSPEDIAKLKTNGVYALPVYSIESLYYHPEIQRRVAERQVAVTGDDPKANIASATSAALTAFSSHAQRLSERVAEKAVREEVTRRLPRREEIRQAQPVKIEIDIPKYVARELNAFQTYLANGDLTTLLQRYPVRETPALSKIAECLGFQDRGQYESAVLKLLLDDEAAVDFLRAMFDSLAFDIAA